MRTFALDKDNNLVFENGQLVLISDGAAVLQAVRTALLFFKGEWFLDESIGVEWFADILVKNADLSKVESILKSVILGVDNVKSITSFSLDTYNSSTRKLTISFSATTTFGKIDSTEVYLTL